MARVYPFTPKPLPYSFGALVPIIGEETMYYHYDKLYKNYVNRLNRAIESNETYKNMPVEEIIIKSHNMPKDVEVNRAAGGVYNHEMYFESFTPYNRLEDMRNCDAFWAAVGKDYNSRDGFYEDIAETANGVFGSGYAWVAADTNGKIYVAKFANQDNPLYQNAVPLLPIDVWEHAYYLDYRHMRAEHVEKLFDIINWKVVEDRYCKGGI